MKGIDSASTLVTKAVRVGAAVAPDPSVNFSAEEIGLLGLMPFPPGGSWEMEIPSSRTQGPIGNISAIGELRQLSNTWYLCDFE
jgi:hypothetical protein